MGETKRKSQAPIGKPSSPKTREALIVERVPCSSLKGLCARTAISTGQHLGWSAAYWPPLVRSSRGTASVRSDGTVPKVSISESGCGARGALPGRASRPLPGPVA